ncbi:E3 ubiquitin-protein ligase XIAP-like [Mytilus californianus]|uniref:E3 ubiquitin-protein ligase XIAP-like n=1 Tax=Mytilus californianus TaxID=6549 RepID=UPI002245AC6F|nr:E3 ubiquitin-protein ligase XIAP-like [Mytilus californianus]XP_052080557.1 E3 ubiquitin-protein ligase XIAP-like [Mytilus californianus]XP_052080559.1 E3 ubiquitin-protein ligase XIAP-like [Mytilus californianus]
MAVPITWEDVCKQKKLIIVKQKGCGVRTRNELSLKRTDIQFISKTEIEKRQSSLSPILIMLFILFLLKLITKSFKARTKMKFKTIEKTRKESQGKLHVKLGWIFDNIIKPWRYVPCNVYQTYPFLPEETSSYCQNGGQLQASTNMQFEGARFATFATFPHIPGIFATRLAEAGFYYTGSGNEVVCFSCGVTYSCWRHHDSAFEIHKRISPNCPFISDETVKHNEGNQNIGGSGDNKIKEEKNYQNASAATSSGNTFSPHDKTQRNKNDKDSVSGTSIISNPTESRSNAETVATHGILTNSNQNLVSTSKREQKVQKSDATSTGNKLKESTSLLMEGTPSSELLEIGVCFDKAKYPKYAIRSNRLDSFNHWPSYLTQTPEEMATAGFFFTGIEDHCRCFFCGGGLRNWEPEDQPWTEHARWYPKCAFVRQIKGEKFIDDVQSNGYQPILQESGELNLCSRRPDLTSTGKNQVTDHFSTHPAVLSVKEFGYSESLIKKAFDLLQTAGTKVITGTTLFEAILMMEENTTRHESNNTLKMEQAEQSDLSSNEKPETTVDPEFELSIRSLEEENQNLKDQQTCKICLDEPIAIVFLPCGHMASCANCAPALRRCPICRVFIKGTVKAIMC